MTFRINPMRLIVRLGSRPDEPEPLQEPHWAVFRRRVLVVCYANVCRSPVAAALLRERLPRDTWQVLSAGTSAVLGRPATAPACGVASEFGIELSLHRSQPVDAELVRACGLILTMSRRQARAIIDLEPGAASRVRLLGAFAPSRNTWGLPADHLGPPAGREEIADPTGQPSDLHRECFEQLRRATEEVADWLLSGARPEDGPSTADLWRWDRDATPIDGLPGL